MFEQNENPWTELGDGWEAMVDELDPSYIRLLIATGRDDPPKLVKHLHREQVRKLAALIEPPPPTNDKSWRDIGGGLEIRWVNRDELELKIKRMGIQISAFVTRSQMLAMRELIGWRPLLEGEIIRAHEEPPVKRYQYEVDRLVDPSTPYLQGIINKRAEAGWDLVTSYVPGNVRAELVTVYRRLKP